MDDAFEAFEGEDVDDHAFEFDELELSETCSVADATRNDAAVCGRVRAIGG